MIKWAIEKYNHSLFQIDSVFQDLILWIQSLKFTFKYNFEGFNEQQQQNFQKYHYEN